MRNKRKGILMAAAILGSAAIVSTGFAAWVVTLNQTTSIDGNIEVDTVTDNRISFGTVAFVDNEGDGVKNLNFGFKANGAVTNPWLTNSNGDDKEDLSASIKFTPSWKDPTRNNSDAANKITVYWKLEVITADFTTLNTYTEDESEYTLITLPTTVSGELSIVPETETTIPLVFGWGTAFGGKNPYTYFNTLKSNGGYLASATPNETEIDNAIKRLQALKTNIAPVTYRISLSNNSGFNSGFNS